MTTDISKSIPYTQQWTLNHTLFKDVTFNKLLHFKLMWRAWVKNDDFWTEIPERWYEPRHDKTYKMAVCPAKTQISLGIRPVRSESSLSAWRKLGSIATHWAHSEDSDQTGRISRLIWVFAGRTPLILLILSCRGSYFKIRHSKDF